MKTKPFNLEEYLKGAKAVSRDGKKVKEILKFTTETTHPLVVLFEDGWLIRVHEDGSALNSDEMSSKDILLVVEPKRIYANVYKGKADYPYIGEYFKNKEKAKEFGSTSKTYIKTIEITDEL